MIYIVPTPIGNMGDITFRSKEVLLNCEILIAESFQESSKLLKNLGREKLPKIITYVNYDKFNEKEISLAFKNCDNIAIVSDAGMPMISDPGYLVIDFMIKNNIKYSVLAGPSSVDVAVAASGLISKGFVFLGFIPNKKGRQTFWKEAKEYNLPIVLFESVHRIDKCLEDLKVNFESNDKVFIARELTKMYEEYIHTKIEDLDKLNFTKKGEFVIIVKKNT
jgi:16S rRNA (cytidine1402-2'-O)-methyltransferase